MKLVYIILVIIIGGFIVYKQGLSISIPTNLIISKANTEPNDTSLTYVEELDNQEYSHGEYSLYNSGVTKQFEDIKEAIAYSKDIKEETIYIMKNDKTVWDNEELSDKVETINLPHIKQYPELPRGCEVTSLAMLLQYYGVDVDKMVLADQVKKDSTLYSEDENGRKYYGDPYEGFVGDMYNLNNRGYGVYHGPIAELATEYMGDDVIDVTGVAFEDVLKFVSLGYPVWVVTNATFDILPEEAFEIWHTPTSIVKITMRMHSVVITGYDQENVYINDPLYHKPNRATNKEAFKRAWEQMGNQAIIIIQ